MRPIPPYRFLRPPSPTFTETDVMDLTGKIFIVTGATSGVGRELCKMLYRCNATVYYCGRCPDKLRSAYFHILGATGRTHGKLVALLLDLTQFTTIRHAVKWFLQRENRLDVIVHNAGVMSPPPDTTGESDHDLEMLTNCIGPFLFTRYLEDCLVRTARLRWVLNQGPTRIIWVSSMLALGCPESGMVMHMSTGKPRVLRDPIANHQQSKIGNLYLAVEASKRLSQLNVLSLAVNPGFVRSELFRHTSRLRRRLSQFFFKPARYGAYTELFACVSDELNLAQGGTLIAPWGRLGPIPRNLVPGLLPEQNGGTGKSKLFWNWCDRQTWMHQQLEIVGATDDFRPSSQMQRQAPLMR